MVVAMDGDRGKPNQILYSLLNGESGATLGTGLLLGCSSYFLGDQSDLSRPLWVPVSSFVKPEVRDVLGGHGGH